MSETRKIAAIRPSRPLQEPRPSAGRVSSDVARQAPAGKPRNPGRWVWHVAGREVRASRAGGENLELHQLAIESVKELGRSFDLIVCTGVLHHPSPAHCEPLRRRLRHWQGRSDVQPMRATVTGLRRDLPSAGRRFATSPRIGSNAQIAVPDESRGPRSRAGSWR
jgi:hypothetical protein